MDGVVLLLGEAEDDVGRGGRGREDERLEEGAEGEDGECDFLVCGGHLGESFFGIWNWELELELN